MIKIVIRQVKPEDSEEIWKIRNEPSARSVSGNPDAISFEDHERWFKNQYFSGKNNFCFVTENDTGVVIGYVRFDFVAENNVYRVSIALSPDSRGKGLGKSLLSESISTFAPTKPLAARIKKDNIGSIKIFEKAGFQRVREDNDHYFFEYAVS